MRGITVTDSPGFSPDSMFLSCVPYQTAFHRNQTHVGYTYILIYHALKADTEYHRFLQLTSGLSLIFQASKNIFDVRILSKMILVFSAFFHHLPPLCLHKRNFLQFGLLKRIFDTDTVFAISLQYHIDYFLHVWKRRHGKGNLCVLGLFWHFRLI